MCQDPQLTSSMIDYMLEQLHKSLPYEEKRVNEDETVRTATQVPAAVSISLIIIIFYDEKKKNLDILSKLKSFLSVM